jgi:hypothetical protein
MKASVLQELANKLNPNEEVSFELIREKDVQEVAKDLNVTITPNQAVQIVRAITYRGDYIDDTIEHYVRACLNGELDEV